MIKIHWIKCSSRAMLVAAGFAIAAPSAFADTVTLKLATIAPAKSVWKVMVDQYAQRVAELSNGELVVDIYPGGQLGNMSDSMSKVLRGRIDIWAGPSPVMAALKPAVSTLMLPYQFESKAELGCVMPKLYDQTRNLFADKGEFLAFLPAGSNNITNIRSVRVPADIAGTKMRTSPQPLSNILMQSYGANAVPMNPVETTSALSTGLVSGGDSGLAFWMATGQFKTAKHFLLTEHYHNVAGMLVGPKSWAKLSAEHQQALTDATDVLAFGKLQKMLDGFESKVSAIVTEAGASITSPTAEEMKLWRAAGLASWGPILKALEGNHNVEAYRQSIADAKAACS